MVRSVSRWATGCAVAVVVCSSVSALEPASAAAAPDPCRPRVVDLGDPLGGRFSTASDVSPDGRFVVGTATDDTFREHAVRWENGTAVDLGVIGRFTESYGEAVNSAGTAVGYLTFRGTDQTAFIHQGTRMRTLPGIGGFFTVASAINESGVIAGAAGDAMGRSHAVIWTDNGRVVQDLGVAPGATESGALGLNAAGTAVGYSFAGTGRSQPVAFRRGAVTVLGTAALGGVAAAVNGRGDVVGNSFPRQSRQHAVSWSLATPTRARDLGVLPGGVTSKLVDVDASGAAVGDGDMEAGGHLHPVYWPGQGPLLTLRALSGRLRDYGFAAALDARGNAVGGSVTSAGDVHGTVWNCAASQAVNPAA